MAEKDGQQLVVSFTDGLTEGVAEEVAEGVVIRSENTRLSKLKGTVSRRPKEEVIGTVPNAPTCGGMVTGMRESVIAYLKPHPQPRRIIDKTVNTVYSTLLGVYGQNAYYPYPLIEAGQVSATDASFTPATAFDPEGRQWFVTSKSAVGQGKVFVSIIHEEKDLITPTMVHTQNVGVSWLGITPCTGGMIVWYSGTAGAISCRKVTFSAGALFAGTEHVMHTPVGASPVIQADVVSDGVNSAWLIARAIAGFTDVVLQRFDLTTFSMVTITTLINAVSNTASPPYFCVTYYSGPSGARLAVATSDFTGVCYRGLHNPTSLTVFWSSASTVGYGPVSGQPYVQSGRDSVIFALSTTGAVGVGTDLTQTVFEERSRAAGTLIGTVSVPWYTLQSNGVAHRISNQEIYPYFPLNPRWGTNNVVPTLPGGVPTNFMDTPQIVVVTPYAPDSTGAVQVYTPVMRCGVDRVLQAGANGNSSPSALSADGRFGLVYLAERWDQPISANELKPVRYCVFDLASSGQPGVAADVGPVGVNASGLVAVWDGKETTEYGPFTRPKIAVNGLGGSGPSLTGTYLYTAVVSWRDAADNVRRSAPALPVTVVLAGSSPRIDVSIPLTMRSGVRQPEFELSLYATMPGGVIFYAILSLPPTKGIVGCWRFEYILDTKIGTVQLYSLGGSNEPLLPECPPPAQDVRSIAGRLWLIDAENRYRLLPSLLKQQGIAFEFNSNLEIIGFDQQYGRLVAVVDVGGNPFVLAERGIWRIDGYGPDNAGMGGSFTDPQLVSNIGCRSRLSVAQVPNVGVLFQCNDGHMALMTGSVQRFETFGVYEVGPPTVHLLQNEVVYPLSDGTGSIVYNWLANGWTKWPTATRVLPSTTMLQTEERSRTYYYASDGSLLIMDSDTVDVDPARPLLVERGWVAPEGPHGDCRIREFWVHVIYNNPHSVRVRATFDYDTTFFREQTWTDLELVPLLQDGRYTIGMNCEAMPARAIRVLVEFTPEGPDEGGQPLSLVVTYGASPGIRRRTLREGAIK
jgi:hypothetical protein